MKEHLWQPDHHPSSLLLWGSGKHTLKRNIDMEHINTTYNYKMMRKGRSITIEKLCNTELTWPNCNGSGRQRHYNTRLSGINCNNSSSIKGRWKLCNTRLSRMNCNGSSSIKGTWKPWNIKTMWLNNSRWISRQKWSALRGPSTMIWLWLPFPKHVVHIMIPPKRSLWVPCPSNVLIVMPCISSPKGSPNLRTSGQSLAYAVYKARFSCRLFLNPLNCCVSCSQAPPQGPENSGRAFEQLTALLLLRLWLSKWMTPSSMVHVLMVHVLDHTHSKCMVVCITVWEHYTLKRVGDHLMRSSTSMMSRRPLLPITFAIQIWITPSWQTFKTCSLQTILWFLCTSRPIRSCRRLLQSCRLMSVWP